MQTYARKNIYKIAISVVFLLLAINIGVLQMLSGSYYALKGRAQVYSELEVIPPRGIIYDANGVILAESKPVYDIFLEKNSVTPEEISSIIDLLEQHGIPTVSNSLEEEASKILIAAEIEEHQALSAINLAIDGLPINVVKKYIRNYPYPQSFSNIVGYVGYLEEGFDSEKYSPTEKVGKFRLEKYFEDQLKGRKGSVYGIGGFEQVNEITPGKNLQLTIDAGWQNELYRLLGEYEALYSSAGGAAVIMNIKTGEVKAMVSYPGFDANLISKGLTEEEYNKFEQIRSKPLLDKSISVAATPGSIFKLIVTYSLLQNKFVSESTTSLSRGCMNIGSYEFCEFGKIPYGNLNIVSALARSSNIFFCDQLLKLEGSENLANFYKTIDQLPFGKPTGIVLEGESVGKVDGPSGQGWFSGDICNAAIGQGTTLVTPLQMTIFIAAMYNGGEVLIPNLVKEESSDSEVKRAGENLDISSETRSLIELGMQRAATGFDSVLSGFFSSLPNNLRVKTGSAETVEVINGTAHPRVNSWITGVFDFEGETYSFTFFQLYGGGGYYIAPMVRDFLNSINK